MREILLMSNKLIYVTKFFLKILLLLPYHHGDANDVFNYKTYTSTSFPIKNNGTIFIYLSVSSNISNNGLVSRRKGEKNEIEKFTDRKFDLNSKK